MAFTLDEPAAAPNPPLPSPTAFTAARSIPLLVPGGRAWRAATPGAITVVDLNADGGLDLFLANALTGDTPNAVVQVDGGSSALDLSHPLARVRGVRAALWGDIDDDGLIDAVLLGDGTTSVWRQSPAGRWRDVTTAMRAATPGLDAVDAALFDADHDGDLDLWLVSGRGPNELLNNNGDGTFRRIAVQAGLAGDSRPSRGVTVTDLDGDRDHDLVVLKAAPPHEVFLNDRVWSYRPAPGMAAFTAATLDAVVAADSDADGQVELYTSGPRGLERWQPAAGGAWTSTMIAPADGGSARQLAIADVNGDGTLEVLASRADGWAAWSTDAQGNSPVADHSAVEVGAWAVVHGDAARGPSVFGLGESGLIEWEPGPQRPGYLALVPTGREIASDQRRSNTSGIGTRIAVRSGSRWTAIDTVRTNSGPGQSLQPVSVGLGGSPRADFVSLVWSDGILQTEIDLAGGRLHRIEETQRQLSSCPVLFAFDGSAFRFVTDILGVGGIGFFERPGVYSPPHPHERVLLPEAAIAAHDRRYALILGEPMEEVTYLDRAALTVYDLPPGWQIALDERKAIAGPTPSGAPIFFRQERRPVRVTNDRGQDVTRETAAADLVAAPPGAVDHRFIGRTEAHTVTLEFDTPVADGPGAPVLMIDGWVEYPYAQTVFAAWQAGALYQAPTLEARGGDGRWHVVAREFGYPAGMPRRMTFPLPPLPAGATALRLTTTQEIFWDRLAVIYGEPRARGGRPAGAADYRHASPLGLRAADDRPAAHAALRLRRAGAAARHPAPRGMVQSARSGRAAGRARRRRGGDLRTRRRDPAGVRRTWGAAAGGMDPPGRARRQGLVQGHGPLHPGRRDGGAVAWGRLGGAARAPWRVQHALRGRAMSVPARATPVGPALRWLLRLLYLLTGLLTATAVYLFGVSAAEAVTGASYQGYVYQWTVLVHLAVGLAIVVPFLVYAPAHALAARAHPNRRAARIGYVLAALASVVLVSGLALMRVAGFELRQPGLRTIVYWLHVVAPLGVAWAFVNHRRRGRALRGGAAWAWAAATAALVALTAAIDARTSRPTVVTDDAAGFAPSFARTASGEPIPAAALMVDDYCASATPTRIAAGCRARTASARSTTRSTPPA